MTRDEIGRGVDFTAGAVNAASPADVYVLRRQVAPANSTTALGREARDALRDSLPLFPAAILTDVPYLLLRQILLPHHS